jgi:hypothetical protein
MCAAASGSWVAGVRVWALMSRYGDRMRDVTYTAVKERPPTKGMPTWGDVLSADAIGKILTFLESVQN